MNANETIKELGLTRPQWEILKHRLEVPEAIADALADYHPDDVIYVAECLEEGDWDRATCHSPEIRDAVLAEAVNGSTYLAAERGWGSGSGLILANIERSGEALAKKVQVRTGVACVFPTY